MLELGKLAPKQTLQIPDISGDGVCRRIKHDPRTASVSVLQISVSFVSNDDRVRALEAGVDGYLTHPIDRMVLVSTVRALLRLRTAEAEARKAAEKWQSAFDALSEGLVLIDGRGRLIRWNSAFAEICGSTVHVQAGTDAASFLEDLLGTGEPVRRNGQHYGAEFTVAKRSV